MPLADPGPRVRMVTRGAGRASPVPQWLVVLAGAGAFCSCIDLM